MLAAIGRLGRSLLVPVRLCFRNVNKARLYFSFPRQNELPLYCFFSAPASLQLLCLQGKGYHSGGEGMAGVRTDRDLEAARGSAGERSRLLGNGDSDDELLGARSAGTSRGTENKVTGVQQQVQGVMTVMQDNINKILERGENLDNLESRSENLNVNADHFRRGATQVRRRMWWNNCRMKLIIAFVILAIIAIIVAVTVTETQKKTQ